MLRSRGRFEFEYIGRLLAEDGPAVVYGNRGFEKLWIVDENIKPSIHCVSVASYFRLIVGMGFVQQALWNNSQHVDHLFPVGGTKPFLQRVNLIDVIAQRHRIRFRLFSHGGTGIVQKKNFVRMKLHGTGILNYPSIYPVFATYQTFADGYSR